jgi:ribonuclease HII
VDHEEIDRINILKASIKAMHMALDHLQQRPTAILIDGNYFISYSDIPHQCVIQGDGIYASIAAASILAKTYRDEYMQQLHENYPEYGWKTNKGYATIQHRHALASFGPSPFHRKSFNWQTEQLEFEF